MDLNINLSLTLLLKKWKTTNKVVAENNEVLTGYLSFTGLVPSSIFGVLSGQEPQQFEDFFWDRDGQIRHPGMGAIPFTTIATGHVIDFPSLKYKELDATLRKFKLEPAFGKQWSAHFEVLVRPQTDAPVGRFASAEGHEIEVVTEGFRQLHLVTEDD